MHAVLQQGYTLSIHLGLHDFMYVYIAHSSGELERWAHAMCVQTHTCGWYGACGQFYPHTFLLSHLVSHSHDAVAQAHTNILIVWKGEKLE